MALIWDTSDLMPEIKSPIKKYDAGVSVTNVEWGINEKNWIGICCGNTFKTLKVSISEKGI